MKRSLGLLVALLAVGSVAAATEIVCEGEYDGHLQGVATDGASIYWSHTKTVVKTDLKGKILRSVRAPRHQGDLCCHGGTVYVAVNLGKFNTHTQGDSWVFAYDAETLRETKRWKLPEMANGAGGMTWANGRFYVIGGLPLDIEENYVYEYTEDFAFVKRHVLKTGFTHMGIQTAAFEDGRFLFGIYGGAGDPSGTLECPADLGSFVRRTGAGNVGMLKLNGEFWTGRVVRGEGGKSYCGKLVKSPGFPSSEKVYVAERTGKGRVRIFYEGRDASGWKDAGYGFDPDGNSPLFAQKKRQLYLSAAAAETASVWPTVGIGKGRAYQVNDLVRGVRHVAEAGDALAFHVPGTPETLPTVDPEAAEALKAILAEAARLGVRVSGTAGVHPRILADADDFAALRVRLTNDAEFASGAQFVRSVADAIVPLRVLKREKIGKRLLQVSRKGVLRMLTLGMSWQLYGDRRYAERGRRELLALCAFEDWNPSHFLDVGELCVAVGVGYDWLYETLSEEDRKTIVEAVRTKGLGPYLKVKGGWRNNWGQVCHCGCLVGAAAIADVCPEESSACLKMLRAKLPAAMEAYAPVGNFPEGPGYWHYATSYAVLGLETLKRNFDGEELIADAPGFRATFGYPDLVTGPTGLTFNYADGGDGRGSAFMAWYFARTFGRKDLLTAYERKAWKDFLKTDPKALAVGFGGRFFPLTLLWYQDEKEDVPPELPLVWSPGGDVPVAIQRSGWGKDDLFVGLKGGSPSGPHGHMDGGSFVLEAKGVRWAVDLGAEGYTAVEQRGISLWNRSQDSGRWTVYRLSTWAHNTLMIDGAQQKVAGFAKIGPTAEPPTSAITLDLSSLYPAARRVTRCGEILPDGYRLTDRLEGLREGASVRWAMTTRAEATAKGDVLTLSQDGRTLTLTKTAAGSGPWEIAEDAPPNEWDSPNRGCRQVRFFTKAGVSGDVIIKTEMR